MTPLQTLPKTRDGAGDAGGLRGMRRPAVAAALALAVLIAGGCSGGETAVSSQGAGQAGAAGGGNDRTSSEAASPSADGADTSGGAGRVRKGRGGATGSGSAASAGATATGLAKRPRIPRGVTPGYMVFDTAAGKVTTQYRAHARYRSASVVKILIALDYLQSRPRGSAIPKSDLALLQPMLRSSHDNAATALWRRGGQTAIIKRMVRRLKLTDSGPPPADKPGFWGYTAISAADIVKVYRYLLDRAEPAHRDFILGNLRKATQCGADGFDQYFGIPRAVPKPWAIKQGWSGYGSVPPVRCVKVRANSMPPLRAGSDGAATARNASASSPSSAGVPGVDFTRPVLHTTGLVGTGDRFIIVLLTSQPAGATWQSSVSRMTTLTKGVYRAGGGR
ncbi:hypothetical protein AB0K60_29080 [Thermopolyspora sp. NPDC052614]|uniref:hypothetical protein n=1 Tax=Thermopolyspora sp. NPDC052614 TaxID=3155682 RepID=UPI00342FBC99